MKSLLVVLALGLLAVWAADAQLVSNALGSHMVLQRAPQVARLWGWTKSPHERVRLSFNGQNYDVTSGSDRKWVHALPATPAGGPHSILVTSIAEKVLLDDVYFGDVWLCGGQSNMQFTVNTAFNATEEIALANRYPHVRLLTVGQGTTSTEPLPVLKTLEQPWSVANATSVGGKSWQHFSAVCWFFGKQLYDKYQVPIGLVSSNWGGTIVQAWSSPDALSKCKLSEPTVAATEATTSVVAEPTKLGGPNDNSVLWNAMIVPFLDLSLKGAIWYQGESNTGHADYYGCAFPAMINDWRSKFAKSGRELVFLFVQLAPWIGGANTAIPDIRQAQEKALELTDVGMATAIDLGDATSPEGNIHPRNKQEVGRRLALAADHIAYGDNNVVYLNPRATSAFVVDHSAGHVRVHFDKNTMPGGLVVHNNVCQVDAKFCTGYELQIDRGHWVAAKGELVEDGTIVDITTTVPQGSRLTGVRYAWSDWPICTLYSRQGLPALQFSFLL